MQSNQHKNAFAMNRLCAGMAAVLTIGLGLAGGAAHAAEGKPAQDGAPAGSASVMDIIRINQEIQLLQAELKRVELQAQIAAKRAEIAKNSKPERTSVAVDLPLPSPLKGASVTPGSMESAAEDVPFIQAVEGLDGNLSAVIAYPEGRMTVQEGDAVLYGWSVQKISATGVMLRRGGEQRRLGFGKEAPKAPQTMGPR